MLSPVSKKKTGRAYVALARAHSEKFVINYIHLAEANSRLTEEISWLH